MPIFGRYYQLSVKNAEKDQNESPNPQLVNVRIYDMSLEDDTTFAWDIIEIEGSYDPFRTATVDNAEDKFTPIKPTQATIKFLSSNQVKLSNFVNAPIDPGGVDVGDQRWFVVAYLNTYLPENTIFKGYLNLDDCSEDFLPEKNEVVLVANDGLGGLKNFALTDFAGNNPTGYNRIADYLTWALSKTGLSLELNTIFNIRESTLTDSHFFDVMYLHAKTFEDKIGVSINCYDVLERILGEEAFLTQRAGQWWIVRIDELAGGNPLYNLKFNTDGTPQTIDAGKSYDKVIEKDSQIFFSEERTRVFPVRPYKYIKETYKFEYPLEIVDNIDFSRGDLFTPLDMSNVVIDGVTYYQSKYHIADWQLKAGTIGTPTAPTSTAFIQRLFSDINRTYEKSRHLAITATGGTTNWLESNPIPISKEDKFNVSVDFSLDGNLTGNILSYYGIGVLLLADDGTKWVYGSRPVLGDYKWTVYAGPADDARAIYASFNNNDTDETKWNTISGEVAPAPASGEIYLRLFGHSTNEIRYINLGFEYIPFINGAYSKYDALYHKISTASNKVIRSEKQVYISDSPKKLFKGSLFKQVAGKYVLSDLFYAWNDIHTNAPDWIYLHPYAHLQAYDIWNQFRNPVVKFMANVQGLDGGAVDQNGYVDHPHLVHRFLLQDTNDNTNDRVFMLLTFDIDWYTCEWTGTLIEIFNTVTAKSYLDIHEIKYE
jgi:hypothetical protein